MTKNNFLNQLRNQLSAVSKEEQDRVIEYYSEIINDKIDDGKSEEQAISELNSPQKIAQKIIEDYENTKTEADASVYKHSKAVIPKKRSVGAIIGFSALLPFVFIMLAVLLIVSFAFFATAFAFIVAGAVYFVSSFFLIGQSLAVALFQFGFSLFFIAVGAFAMFGSVAFEKLCIRITKNIFNKYVQVYGGIKDENS